MYNLVLPLNTSRREQVPLNSGIPLTVDVFALQCLRPALQLKYGWRMTDQKSLQVELERLRRAHPAIQLAKTWMT